MDTIKIIKTYKHTPAQQRASKKYYEANKEDKIKKALKRYTDKYNSDEEFKLKRKEYMKQYQQKKRDMLKNAPKIIS